jgi:hypothetical protein
MVDESNEVCQKTLRGTGLTYHVYPCLNHLADFRQRLGLDNLVDAYISLEAARRLRKVWPDKRVEQRELGEAEVNPEIAALTHEPKP